MMQNNGHVFPGICVCIHIYVFILLLLLLFLRCGERGRQIRCRAGFVGKGLQCCPIELSAMIEMHYTLSDMV